MESSPNVYTEPMSRYHRFIRFIVQRHNNEFDAMSDHWRPSAQRDVGKTAAEAEGVQLMIDFLNQ